MVVNEYTKLADKYPDSELIMKVSPSMSGDQSIYRITDANRQECLQLAESLKSDDLSTISDFGLEIQKRIDKQSAEFLNATKTNKVDKMGELISNLLVNIESVNVDDLDPKYPSLRKIVSKIPFVRGAVKTVDKVIKEYEDINTNINKISQDIQATRLKALYNNNNLEKLYEYTVDNMRDLEKLIIAGKIRLDEEKTLIETKLDEGVAEWELQKMKFFAQRLESKVTDLMTLHFTLEQNLGAIQLVEQGNFRIADKAQTIVSMTIPVWRSQFVMAINLIDQKNAVEQHKMVTDMTNAMYETNAQMLKDNVRKVAIENERSIVDIETLKKTQASFIETIKEAERIHKEGVQKRATIEAEIAKLHEQTKAQLAETLLQE